MVELVEDGVKLCLTVIDTPGFGDQLNRSKNFAPIKAYIENQYDVYHQSESGDVRKNKIVDNRVHALLYFLPPTGKSK
jgi:septin family protein